MIVLDNSTISAFCEIGKFGLLKTILSNAEVVVPSTVEREIVFDAALSSLTRGETTGDRWIKVIDVMGYESYLDKLHDGESGVIRLAKDKRAVAVLDDLDAREIAKNKGVKISGTLGMLKLGYELCPIKTKRELKMLIDELRDVHFRIDEGIEKQILEAEE